MPDDTDLLQRRMDALRDPEMRLGDWDTHFVGTVCHREPADLTPRQREMVAVLAWRYRAQLDAALVPAKEPKLSPKPDRSHFDAPLRRQRGPRAAR